MKRYLIFLLLPILTLSAQDEELISRALVYSRGVESALLIDSPEKWIPLGLADLSNHNYVRSDSNQTFRLRFRLNIKEGINTDSTILQLRFNQGDRISTFAMELEDRDIRNSQGYTNWYIPPESFSNESWQGPVSLRLISAPGKDVEIQLSEIELQLWVEKEIQNTNPSPVMADSGSFFVQKSAAPVNPYSFEAPVTLDERDVMEKALVFIKSLIEADLPAFYGSLSDQIYSLNTGLSYSRYRISPPSGLQNYSFIEYKADFDYKLYSYRQFIELFPQWAEDSRTWKPNESTYLFIGNRHKSGQQSLFDKEDMLVFMLAPVGEEFKIIARPEF